MDIVTTRADEGSTLTLNGRVDAAAAGDLESALRSAAAEPGEVSVDFANVDYIGSAGLRSLLIGARLLATDGRRLIVERPSDDVMDVIRLTGFDRVLAIRGDEVDGA